MMDHWILDDNKEPIKVDLLTWARWFEFHDRKVALTEIGYHRISTVFLGIDHNFSGTGPPVLFETMVFDRGRDVECYRWATWRESVAGHNRTVRRWLDILEKFEQGTATPTPETLTNEKPVDHPPGDGPVQPSPGPGTRH